MVITKHNPFAKNNHRPPSNEFRQSPPLKPDAPPSSMPGKRREPPPHDDDSLFFPELSHDVFLFFVVMFFSLSLGINNRLKQVQQEKMDAELSYLKSQINPHFLFNTLNLINSLAVQKSDKASEAVVQLANMMRYVIYESNKNFVSLQQEINYVQNYIELQQMRFGSSIQLLFEVSGDTSSNKKIAPLILIPFIENAFKHGVNAAENSDIKIYIEIIKNELQLKVYNTKVNTAGLNENEGGVGIANTTNRLNLLYAGKHELLIENNANDFFVHLKLHLYD